MTTEDRSSGFEVARAPEQGDVGSLLLIARPARRERWLEVLRPLVPSVVATSGEEESFHFRRSRWLGACAEWSAARVGHAKAIRGFRAAAPNAPMLLWIEPTLCTTRTLERAFRLGVTTVLSVDSPASTLRSFVREKVLAQDPVARARAAISSLENSYHLTPAEADVLRLSLICSSREAVAAARGTSPRTTKRQVEDLLAKCRREHCRDLIEEVRAQAALTDADLAILARQWLLGA